MDLQVGAPSEALYALVTSVGLLPGVNPHVDFQATAMTEAFHALVTPVGLLLGMNTHVDLQVIAPSEALHALVTPVGLLPGVNPHVDLQVVALTEALHALVTPVGLLPGVNPHVGLQVGAQSEALHALVTPVGLLLRVNWTELVTGHLGRARGVRLQTIRGGAVLCAAASNVISIFCREENKYREVIFILLFAQRDTVCTLYTLNITGLEYVQQSSTLPLTLNKFSGSPLHEAWVGKLQRGRF